VCVSHFFFIKKENVTNYESAIRRYASKKGLVMYASAFEERSYLMGGEETVVNPPIAGTSSWFCPDDLEQCPTDSWKCCCKRPTWFHPTEGDKGKCYGTSACESLPVTFLKGMPGKKHWESMGLRFIEGFDAIDELVMGMVNRTPAIYARVDVPANSTVFEVLAPNYTSSKCQKDGLYTETKYVKVASTLESLYDKKGWDRKRIEEHTDANYKCMVFSASAEGLLPQPQQKGQIATTK